MNTFEIPMVAKYIVYYEGCQVRLFMKSPYNDWYCFIFGCKNVLFTKLTKNGTLETNYAEGKNR